MVPWFVPLLWRTLEDSIQNPTLVCAWTSSSDWCDVIVFINTHIYHGKSVQLFATQPDTIFFTSPSKDQRGKSAQSVSTVPDFTLGILFLRKIASFYADMKNHCSVTMMMLFSRS